MMATSALERQTEPGSVGVSARTTVGLFLRQADRFGDRAFVRYYDARDKSWKEMSWNRVRSNVLSVARGLLANDIQPHDRVLLFSENRVEWLYCDLGIQAAGAVTVPVYANLIPGSVEAIARDAEARLAFVSDASHAATVRAVGNPPRVVTMDADLPRWLSASDARADGVVATRLMNLRPEDVATIAYTSGTSGQPKGAVISHGTIVDVLDSCRKAYDIGPDDVILSILPYAHIFERIAAFYFGAILSGAELDLGRGIEHLLDDIQTVRPTCMDAVPRLFEKLTQKVQATMETRSRPVRVACSWSMRTAREHARQQHPGWWLRLRYRVADRLVLRRMRQTITGGRLRFFMSGGAPLAPEVEEFFWAIGVPIYQGWGMTELTCVTTCNTIAEHRLGTVGKPLAGFELRRAPDGEILVRGPGVMREYNRNPAATAEVMSDGWFHTGDIGEIDRDGFLSITDRKKDLIKTSGGKYVAPQPIEVKLRQDPHIDSAVVVGDGRPYVTALIVPDWPLVAAELNLEGEPADQVSEARVLSLIRKRVDEVNRGLNRFETVKYFRLLPTPLTVEAGEVTASFKVRRHVVQEHYRKLIDEMYSTGGPLAADG